MKIAYKLLTGVAAILCVGTATMVSAHPEGGMGMGPGPEHCMGEGMAPGGGPMAHRHGPAGKGAKPGTADPSAWMEARFAKLKTELKLSDKQEPAWQAYETKAKQQAKTMLAARTAMHSATGSAPELMAQRNEMMKQHLGNMETMTAALKDFYAVLTPEQKTTADKFFAEMPGRRMAKGRPQAK